MRMTRTETGERDSMTTNYQAKGEQAVRARAILEKKIEDGRASAAGLFERVHQEAPRDSVVRGRALNFRAEDGEDLPRLAVQLGDGEILGIHRHALSQLGQRAGVPGAYLSDLSAGPEWQRGLAAEILNRHYHEGAPDQRYLTRAVKGEVRGVLSDKYRRLDSRPLVEAFATECQALGAVAVDGTCSDTRVALKALLPQVYEPVQGEVLAFGVEWGNSDYGHGMHAVRAFMLRVWCLNGATMENALAQVHIGRQMSEEIELSQRTYELDTRASVSALRDVVRGVLAPAKVEAMCDGIRRAEANQVEWKSLRTSLAKKLPKGELEAARAAFESEDVYNLPAGNTMWRASNAISWIAGQAKDADRRLDLQRLAGELVTGKRDVEIAAAA